MKGFYTGLYQLDGAPIYSRARGIDVKKFLLHLIETAPYKIQSIQVDGGSEFMLEFEQAIDTQYTSELIFELKARDYFCAR